MLLLMGEWSYSLHLTLIKCHHYYFFFQKQIYKLPKEKGGVGGGIN